LIVRERNSTAVNLPLSPECKRILAYTQQEAEHLNHAVGAEHLLLGILREEESKAAEILRKHGLQVSVIRETLIQSSLRKRH
jgi:ATP-dependent Clp protease ATP-binding subunit ClpC